MKELLGFKTPNMKFADLHMHTNRQDGKMEPQQVVDMALSVGHLHAVAVTEHNKISPALDAKRYAETNRYPILVVVGEEISTKDGHILGLFIEDEIVRGIEAEEAVRQIHRQGGLAIPAHPFYKRLGAGSLGEAAIRRVIESPDPEIYFDGIEIFNQGVEDLRSEANNNAREFFLKNRLLLGAPIGSTDGHFYGVGRAFSGYEGDLKCAIQENNTAVFTLDPEEQWALVEKAKKIFGEEKVMERINRLRAVAQRRGLL